MPRKSTPYPAKGELVLGTITRVNPFSVQISLDEYPGKEGTVNIGEVARKWIRDIRDFAKEGQKLVVMVLDVDTQRGTVILSMKRVDKRQESSKLKEVKQEQKAEKMLQAAAKELGFSLDDAYKQVGFKLQMEFGELFKAFQNALTPAGRELLKNKGISEKWIAAISKVSEKEISPKEVEIKFEVEIQTPAPNGVDVIKKSLSDAQKKFPIFIKYLSAPKYSLVLKTKDAKNGEHILEEASQEIIKAIKASGGEGKFEKVD